MGLPRRTGGVLEWAALSLRAMLAVAIGYHFTTRVRSMASSSEIKPESVRSVHVSTCEMLYLAGVKWKVGSLLTAGIVPRTRLAGAAFEDKLIRTEA